VLGHDPEGVPDSSGVRAFSVWFRQKCRLKSLNLSSNFLGNAEAEMLADDLRFMNDLHTLNLRDNEIKVGTAVSQGVGRREVIRHWACGGRESQACGRRG
jgi:hypothetical protein